MRTKTPQEDPRSRSAREAEERRAEAAVLETTTDEVDDETRRRIRKFGARAGRVMGMSGMTRAAAGASTGGGSSGGSGGYQPSYGGAGSGQRFDSA